jgi:hypothetical protein
MIPNARVTKNDGNTGVAAPSSQGICAIIAPCAAGVANQPASATKAGTVLTNFGLGILTEYAAHMLDVTGKPVVLVKATASTAAAYGTVAFAGTGTSVPTAGATAPVDDFDVLVEIVVGGTRGTDGITYTESLDGGKTVSAVKALGTATSIVIPNSGVTILLAAGTLVAGDTITVKTTSPRLTTADVSAALEALRVSQLRWEYLLVGGHEATATTVSILDLWLAAREAEGKFRGFIVNARPRGAAETEAEYAIAMATAFNAAASIRGHVCVDGGDVVSSVPGRGITIKRGTALALAARLMKIAYGTDASFVEDGPVAGGFTLADAVGNPNNHDEAMYPGLDDLRLVTLRSIDNKTGTYITNPNVISPIGSDFVWAQHVRTMNRACELVYAKLTGQLSRGLRKNLKPGPLGEIYVAEEDALLLDAMANADLNELRGQVTDLRFRLSRLDDVGSNGPKILSGDLEISSLVYVKGFAVNASFVRSISVPQ